MNVLFWEDVHTLCQYFRPLFLALLEALTRCDEEPSASADDVIAGGEDAVYCDLLKLAARFICYYDLRSPQNRAAHSWVCSGFSGGVCSIQNSPIDARPAGSLPGAIRRRVRAIE